MEVEFKDLNEQLKTWNSQIHRMNQNISSTIDLIRTIPNQIETFDNATHVSDVVQTNTLSMINRMPILTYSIPPKKLPLLHFENTNPETFDIFNDEYNIRLLANGWFPSAISCIKFSDDGVFLSVAGNSFFFSINYESRAELGSWFAISQSAPNIVVDFDCVSEYVVLAMQDSFIRVMENKSHTIVYEFPSFVEEPTFVRMSPKNEYIVVANDKGNAALQKINNTNEQFEPVKVNLPGKPINCEFLGDNQNDKTVTFIYQKEKITWDIKNNTTTSAPYEHPTDDITIQLQENTFKLIRGQQSESIAQNGVTLKVGTVSKSENPMIAIGSEEGCLYLWQITKKVSPQPETTPTPPAPPTTATTAQETQEPEKEQN